MTGIILSASEERSAKCLVCRSKTLNETTPIANKLIMQAMDREAVQSPLPRPQRPTGVTIIAIVAAAGGLLSLFGGASRLAGMGTGPIALAYVVIVFGILGLALGAGFFTGAKWAWMAGIIIYIISIGLGIAEIIYGGQVGLIGGILRTNAGKSFSRYPTRTKPEGLFWKKHTGPRPKTTLLY